MSARLSCWWWCYGSFHTFYYSANRLRGYFYNRNFEGNEKMSHIHLPHLSAHEHPHDDVNPQWENIFLTSATLSRVRFCEKIVDGQGLDYIHRITQCAIVSCPKMKRKINVELPIIWYTSEWLSVCKFSRRKQVANRLRRFSIISCVFGHLFTSKFISFEGNRRAKKNENFMSDSINYFCVFLLRIEHKLAMKRIFFL